MEELLPKLREHWANLPVDEDKLEPPPKHPARAIGRNPGKGPSADLPTVPHVFEPSSYAGPVDSSVPSQSDTAQYGATTELLSPSKNLPERSPRRNQGVALRSATGASEDITRAEPSSGRITGAPQHQTNILTNSPEVEQLLSSSSSKHPGPPAPRLNDIKGKGRVVFAENTEDMRTPSVATMHEASQACGQLVPSTTLSDLKTPGSPSPGDWMSPSGSRRLVDREGFIRRVPNGQNSKFGGTTAEADSKGSESSLVASSSPQPLLPAPAVIRFPGSDSSTTHGQRINAAHGMVGLTPPTHYNDPPWTNDWDRIEPQRKEKSRKSRKRSDRKRREAVASQIELRELFLKPSYTTTCESLNTRRTFLQESHSSLFSTTLPTTRVERPESVEGQIFARDTSTTQRETTETLKQQKRVSRMCCCMFAIMPPFLVLPGFGLIDEVIRFVTNGKVETMSQHLKSRAKFWGVFTFLLLVVVAAVVAPVLYAAGR